MRYTSQNIHSQHIGSWKNYCKIFLNVINEDKDLDFDHLLYELLTWKLHALDFNLMPGNPLFVKG